MIAKDSTKLKELKELLGADFDISDIKYICIDYTLSDNYKLLTNSKGKNLGKVWKKYHSEDRLLLIVNNDPTKNFGPLTLDTQLQEKMQDLKVPNSENVRFITLDQFMDIFAPEGSSKVYGRGGLMNTINTALTGNDIYGNRANRRAALEKLYNDYDKALEYLQKVKRDTGVGWRLLSNLPF